MELNSLEVTTPALDAATVVMLREAAGGMQVFLLRRHAQSAVLGGVYVFPGGKVDAADGDPALHQLMDQSPAQLHLRLNEPGLTPAGAAGVWVAALRESFEECGVLFARHAQGAVDAAQLSGQQTDFVSLLKQQPWQLHTDALVPWSRWITPRQPSLMQKRFDTRFFLALAPAGQLAEHDNVETTESLWCTPKEALHKYWRGDIELAPPQILSLAHLTRFDSVSSALQSARSAAPALVLPEPFDDNGTRVICYPGDQRHSIRQRALPGPTRFRFINKRFEPEGGFDALFA